ncbi:MAG: 2-C-methyl-D-erythritol 4-phosphate cytidylyltransferase [Firmicutes bacterium]|nr:2-C-methyl-D-erythritol 4-phosphate cytidylyltransferase [Bacillota bacterium]
MSKIYAVVPAAGSGSRMMAGEDGVRIKKQFIKLKDKELLAYTLEVLESVESIDGIILVASKDDMDMCSDMVKKFPPHAENHSVCGGVLVIDVISCLSFFLSCAGNCRVCVFLCACSWALSL